jgi:hypothetical protein
VQDEDFCEDTGAAIGTYFTGEFYRLVDGAPIGEVSLSFEPNARLIAAAPEMLAALQAVMENVAAIPSRTYEQNVADGKRVAALVNAVIAKAEGR